MSVSATKIPVSQITAMEANGADVAQASAAATVNAAEPVELVIEPHKGWIGVDWQELLRHRELLYFLVWRDIKVRYKQAVLGIAWAVLQPVTQMAVFTLIFGFFARFRQDLPIPYALLVLSGLLPWQLFATALTTGGMSLVNQQHLLTKIYFPRLFIPTAVVGGALLDMAVGALLFLAVLMVSGVLPTWSVLLLPVLLILSVVLSLGMAYLLAALTVTYRDFRFVVPFMAQIWMWLSFVAIPPSIIAGFTWKWLFALNPMYSVVAGYRKALLGHKLTDEQIGWDWRYMALSVAMSVGLFLLGLFYFRRTERRFSDIA
jgi:lipopolysaccharide transport system permease protein